jgi:hypothetical protein
LIEERALDLSEENVEALARFVHDGVSRARKFRKLAQSRRIKELAQAFRKEVLLLLPGRRPASRRLRSRAAMISCQILEERRIGSLCHYGSI